MDFEAVFIIWIFIATVALSFVLDRLPISKYIPGPLALMFVPLTLANIGVLPTSAPIYGSIIDISVPLGVALLLLRADIAEIVRNGGPMLGYFFIGVVGSTVGMIVAALLFDFGAGEAALGATLYAFMTGSTVNVIAVAQAVQMDATLFSALFAASVIVSPGYLALVMFLMRSPFIGRLLRCAPGSSSAYAQTPEAQGGKDGSSADAPRPKGPPAPLGQLITLAYALGVYLIVGMAMEALGYAHLTIIGVTVVAILVGNFCKPVRRIMGGDRELGMVFLYLFICALAAQIDLSILGVLAGRIILFWITMLVVHLAVILVAGRILRADPHLLLLASHAGVGGASSTAAIAAAQKRPDLVTPSILCALCGVLIGTFFGLGWYGVAS